LASLEEKKKQTKDPHFGVIRKTHVLVGNVSHKVLDEHCIYLAKQRLIVAKLSLFGHGNINHAKRRYEVTSISF
jgi:hypothetical protein